MSADKCPHCGAEKSHGLTGGDAMFLCGTASQHLGSKSELCLERTAHAATKLKHGQPADEPDPNGSTHARLNWWKERADAVSNELAKSQRELEEAKIDAASWRQQAEQRLDDANEGGRQLEQAKQELNAMRESRDEANERLAALNEWLDFHKGELAATKRELAQARAECGIAHDQRRDEENRAKIAEERAEKSEARVAELDGLRITGSHFFSDFVGVAVNLPLGSEPTIGGTLGQAMPGGAK